LLQAQEQLHLSVGSIDHVVDKACRRGLLEPSIDVGGVDRATAS
jgi:hypothetical protein